MTLRTRRGKLLGFIYQNYWVASRDPFRDLLILQQLTSGIAGLIKIA